MARQTVDIEKETGSRLISRYTSFTNENGMTWQQAFFYVLSWKNTYDFALNVTINAFNNHEAYLEIILRDKNHVDHCKEWLEGLGYGDISAEDVIIATVDVDDYDVEYLALP